jgi:hypothetical protein
MFEQAEKNQGKMVGTPSSFLVDMTHSLNRAMRMREQQ